MIFDSDVMIWAFRGNRRAHKRDLGVCDALIFATACETGETLLSGNKKHFKEVALLNAVEFKPE